MIRKVCVCFVLVMYAMWLTGCAMIQVGNGYTPEKSRQEISQELSKKVIIRQVREKIIRLYHEDPIERAWAAYQLAKIGRGAEPATPYLVNLLDDETPVLLSRYLGGGYHSSSDTTPADEAARALAKIGDAANPFLVDATGDKNANTRRLAAKSLGKIGNIESVPHLIKLLDDEDRRVRATSAIALGNYNHPHAAQLIMDAIPNASSTARADMIYALAQVNDIIVVPFLIQRLPDEEPNVRAAIVHALGKLHDARTLDVLLGSLADKDPIVRANSVYALGNYYAPRVIQALITTLSDQDTQVRDAAVEALAALTGKQYDNDQKKWQLWWETQKQEMQKK